ncbi:hypothetical protein Q8A67_005118 [Cirrhinus molitorella]|uniref:SEA domain-containing protein n=1 Tax=Cirrhinus molitorella TaxID=172907 RepID=A0AA88Q9D0_9TELE|nr:hypothetical protein Q8A67_005118 [Cirrhinus molitorella]
MLQLEPIYRAKYPSFIRVIVLRFSPGSIITDTQLVFNSSQTAPTVQQISDDLVSAVETGGVDPLKIIPASVSVNGSATTTTTIVNEGLTDLVFSSNETFVAALSDSNSEEFKNRSKLVRDELEPIYKIKYANFRRVIVLGFRKGSIITTTQLAFSFNETIPSVQEIANTLSTAVETGVAGLLKINPQTISVNGSGSATTVTPAATTAITATTASGGIKIESSLLQATCLIIMSKILSKTRADHTHVFVLSLFHHSAGCWDRYTDALSDSSSEEFKNRTELVRDELEAVYRPKYANFLGVIVLGFRRGSVIASTQLVFSLNQTIPSVQEIKNILLTASENGELSQQLSLLQQLQQS